MAGSNELCGLTVITEICKKEHVRGNAEILKQLLQEFCDTPVTNLIENSDVQPLGGGEFEIAVIEDPRAGYIAITEDLTFYEYNNGWFLKFQGVGDFISSAVDNGDGTYTFTSFNGNTNFTISLPIGPNESQITVTNDLSVAASDRYKTFVIPSDDDINITVPDLAVPVGFRAYVMPHGNGVVTIKPGEGVELVRDGGKQFVPKKGGTVVVEKIKDGVWMLSGDLKDLPPNYSPVSKPVRVLTPAESGSGKPSLFYLKVHKSSDWPEFGISSEYFVLFSTDHDTSTGGLFWGYCDDYYLNGYEFGGTIYSGAQAETPWLIRIPSSVSGIADEIFLYYHTNNADPDPNPGVQDTHLITTSGGNVPHLCTWNDRGLPLGVEPGENTTGYFHPYPKDSGGYVGTHSTHGLPNITNAVSFGLDGLTYERVYDTSRLYTDEGYFMPNGAHFPFWRNGIRYGISKFITNEGQEWMVLSLLNEDYRPIKFLKYLQTHPNCRSPMLAVDGTTAYVYMKQGNSNADNAHPYYVFTYDLTDVDNLLITDYDVEFTTGSFGIAESTDVLDFALPIDIIFTPENEELDSYIFGKANLTNLQSGDYMFVRSGNNLGLWLYNGSPTDYTFSFSLVNGTEYHYRAYQDGTDIVQEMDGVEVNRQPFTDIGNSSNYFRIANMKNDNIQFRGSIRRFQVGEVVFRLNEGYGNQIEGSDGSKIVLYNTDWRTLQGYQQPLETTGDPIPEYFSDAAAESDGDLVEGGIYFVEGSQIARIKNGGNLYLPPKYLVLTDAVNIDWDILQGQIAEVTLTDNRTLDNPTNLVPGRYSLIVKQDATGSRTLSYGDRFRWENNTIPTLSTDPGATDVLEFISDGTDLFGHLHPGYSDTPTIFLTFDGVDDYVEAQSGNDLNFVLPIRIEYRALQPASNFFLISKNTNPYGSQEGFSVRKNATTGLGLQLSDGGAVYDYADFISETTDKQLLEMVLDGSDIVGYLNGVEIWRNPNRTIDANTVPFNLGRLVNYGNNSNVVIYNFQIGTEIFPMNEGTGTTITGSEGTVLDIFGATWGTE